MKFVRFVLVAAVLVTSGFVVSHQAPTQAANGTYTCADLNNPMFDGVYDVWTGPGVSDPWSFKAGDTIRLEANPVGGSIVIKRIDAGPQAAPAPVIELWMNSAPVKYRPYPGTLTYTFASDTNLPAGGYPSLGWQMMGDYPDPQWEVSCTSVAEAQIVPGCDLGMELTPDAAVGAFVWTTDVYWAPDVHATTEITMPAGKTAWVLGMDETGEFYKFVWSCNYLWAPVGTMGPNYDDTWLGTPLPTTVVE